MPAAKPATHRYSSNRPTLTSRHPAIGPRHPKNSGFEQARRYRMTKRNPIATGS
jgi:hypothetical protein